MVLNPVAEYGYIFPSMPDARLSYVAKIYSYETYELLLADETFSGFLRKGCRLMRERTNIDLSLDEVKKDTGAAMALMYFLFMECRVGKLTMEQIEGYSSLGTKIEFNTKDFLENGFYHILSLMKNHHAVGELDEFRDRLHLVLDIAVRSGRLDATPDQIAKIVEVYSDTEILFEDELRQTLYPLTSNPQQYIEHQKESFRKILFYDLNPSIDKLLDMLNHDTKEDVPMALVKEKIQQNRWQFSPSLVSVATGNNGFEKKPTDMTELVRQTQGHRQAFVMKKLTKPDYEQYLTECNHDKRTAKNKRNHIYIQGFKELAACLDASNQIEHNVYYDVYTSKEISYEEYSLRYASGDVAYVPILDVLTIKLCDQLHNLSQMNDLPEHKKERKSTDITQNYLPLARKYVPWIADLMDSVISMNKSFRTKDSNGSIYTKV